MFDLSSLINLPLIWGLIIAVAILFYVLMDGFGLGIGILLPFAPSNKCRNHMINSIIPFWDVNETWLVLGGAGLFAAFPLAYAILMPAFYIPIIIMLLGLIMRGISFELYFKAEGKSRLLWSYTLHYGSLSAAFCQGVILGAFILGVKVNGRNFSGKQFDWISAFSVMTGIAIIFGYALLGSTWLIMKTENITQKWARKIAFYTLSFVCIFMTLVVIITPFLNQGIKNFWFSIPNFYYLLLILLLTFLLFFILYFDLQNAKREYRPFFLSIAIFFVWYFSLGISIYPWIIPFHYTILDAAASGLSLSLMLVVTLPLLPFILIYIWYSYYIFRGKSNNEHIF